ncbi:MAG: DNA helicase [Litoreibacter sp.]
MRLSSPIYKLKHRAKLLARDNGIKLNAALNQIAQTEGYKGWSHLASSYTKATTAEKILRQIRTSDMVLIGARPRHGKTLLGLELTALAANINRTGYFFTLDYNEAEVWKRLGKLGPDTDKLKHSITVDASDHICAPYIIERLSRKPADALIVIDYLQLLDQKRDNPPLDEQVCALKKFATEHGAIIIITSQIHRTFDLSQSNIPSSNDIHLPNLVELSLFDKRYFLHDGEIRVELAA